MYKLLESRLAYRFVATLATFVFWSSGVMKLFDFTSAEGEMTHFGLSPIAFFAGATIALQVGGSLWVVFARSWAWIGAALLALFTVATVPIAHRFWNMSGSAAFLDEAMVQEHVSVIGGLIAVAWLARRLESRND